MKIYKILSILFGVMMIVGIISLFATRPEKAWSTEDWTIDFILLMLRTVTFAIVGAIGLFSQLIIDTINRK